MNNKILSRLDYFAAYFKEDFKQIHNSENTIFESESYILRVGDKDPTPELEYINHQSNVIFNIQVNKKRFHKFEKKFFTVFKKELGRLLGDDFPNYYKEIAKISAKLIYHNKDKDIDALTNKDHFLINNYEKILEERKYIRRFEKKIKTYKSFNPIEYIHADLHSKNIILKPSNEIVIIDFDDIRKSCAEEEVAIHLFYARNIENTKEYKELFINEFEKNFYRKLDRIKIEFYYSFRCYELILWFNYKSSKDKSFKTPERLKHYNNFLNFIDSE